METLNLFAVTSNSDTTEGRGYTITHGYFHHNSIARAVVRDKRYRRYCTMGVQSPDDAKYMVQEQSIIIFDSVEEFFQNTEEERRKRALAKLTPDEKKLLGLN
jgi:hypothetical protein